jgi:hypothetical protein
LTWLAFQPEIARTTANDPATTQGTALLEAYYRKYPERTNPRHPTLFEAFAPRH